ncbi:MAG: radical SAM protein [Candidatus Bathyarchaeota archaeon]|nr:MAG: radical SAM protein [Candidatus Bathyarchaeota archaeon]
MRLDNVRPLIVDALASGRGRRVVTRDVIGAGPRALAGVLEKKGFSPRIALAGAVIKGSVVLKDFDLLLVSGMTSDLTAVRRVVSRWRSKSEGPVLVGGPVASDPVGALLKTRADIAVTGEGELTLKELLSAGISQGILPSREELSRVLGASFLDGDVVRSNGLRPVMTRQAYESLQPSTEIVKDYPLHRSARVYVEVLRGCSNYHRARLALPEGVCEVCGKCHSGSLEDRYYCPQGVPPGCGYCSVPSLFGPPKSRPVDRVVDEVEALLSLGARRVVLSAPGFLDYGRDLLVEPEPLTDPRNPEPNYEAIEELLSRLTGLERVAEGQASVMIENLKGELVTERAAAILGRYLAGTAVNVGFETGSEDHSLQIGRSSIPQENLRAVRGLKRAGLKPYVYFIHGLPGRDAETVQATVEAIGESVKAGASRIILYRFQPLPMSAFQGRPSAPPAVKDPLSKRIFDEALKANELLKEDLIGTRLMVVVAETYDRDRRFKVAYPMLHGPVVLVEGGEGMDGEIVEVEVSGVVSDRMIRGLLLPESCR